MSFGLRWMPWISGLIFMAWCIVLSWNGPGLQYDEALSVRGGVNLTAKAARLTTCIAGMDTRVKRRCWPLMILPYAGAVKDYVAFPLFRIFGIHVFVARMTAALLGAIGIIGFSIFLRDQVSLAAGATYGLLMAAQPAYLDQVVFDNGDIALSMGFIGIVAWTGNRFCKSQNRVWAFALGLACGAAAWGRLNFLWIIAAVLIGIVIAFPWRQLLRPEALLLMLGGGLCGAVPMLLYHWNHQGDLQSFMKANASYHSFPEFLQYFVYRIQMASEMLFSDREHRAIWKSNIIFDPGARYYWLIILAIALWCVFRRDPKSGAIRWARCMGVALIVLLAICLTSQLTVAQHHLVVLIPFVAVCWVVMLLDVATLGRTGKLVATVAVVLYVGAACAFNTEAAIGINRTRGIDRWSDAINSVDELVERDRTTTLNVLDWGLAANIYFLSKATLLPTELFWDADVNQSGRQITWAEEVAKGGRFLTTTVQDRAFPAATAGFEKALQESHTPFSVQVFKQRNGSDYALLYSVAPVGVTQPK